jgi:hypothetical protein
MTLRVSPMPSARYANGDASRMPAARFAVTPVAYCRETLQRALAH